MKLSDETKQLLDSANFVHLVFSTKNRVDSIPARMQEQLWAYLVGIAHNLRIKAIAVGGTTNHIHLPVGMPQTMTVAEAVQKLKANSSRWLSSMGEPFQWQEGYGAFSVSPSQLETVRRYVRNQAEHHRKRCFEEEFRILLERSGIVYDAGGLFAA